MLIEKIQLKDRGVVNEKKKTVSSILSGIQSYAVLFLWRF